MNLQEELKSLKERIAELEEQAKDEQEFPQYGDEYWYVDDIGLLWLSVFGKGELSNDRVEMGNVFRTKEEAGFVAEKIKIEAELRKFSRPFEYGENNHYIFLDTDNDCTGVEIICYRQTQGGIYFESKEKAQKAIESVGEERIKKYIFEEG